MFYEVYTLFPQFYHSFFHTGLLAKSVAKGVISYQITNIRNFGEGRYLSVDDAPYGGGSGMLLRYSVLKKTLENSQADRRVLLSPRGAKFTQKKIDELVNYSRIAFICGHYEGVDQRFIDSYIDEEISIGDYILSGGETASLVVMEAVSRKLTGFVGNSSSLCEESFEEGLLEHDQYTRPDVIDGAAVPPLLTCGHHLKIERWKKGSALVNTWKRRPEMLKKFSLSKTDIELLTEEINSLSI